MLLVLPDSVPVLQFVVGWLAVTNVVLTVFNLLPAFPMDGGRVLRALLARNRPYGSATRLAARIGVVFAILFAVVGVLSFSPLLVLLALFVYGAATTESRTVLLDELLEGLTVGDIMSRDAHTVPADATLEEFVRQMLRERQQVYPVTDDGVVVGVVTIADLKGVKAADRETTDVRAVMRDVPRVGPASDAFETLANLNQARDSVALVEDEGGLVGVLSEADYAHALSVQRGFKSGLAT